MPAAREVRRRIWRELTDEEQERLARVREQIAAELPEIAAEARARIAAIEETSFSGDLRRAIHASELSEPKIAERAASKRSPSETSCADTQNWTPIRSTGSLQR